MSKNINIRSITYSIDIDRDSSKEITKSWVKGLGRETFWSFIAMASASLGPTQIVINISFDFNFKITTLW